MRSFACKAPALARLCFVLAALATFAFERPARADLTGPEDAACRDLREGDVCDDSDNYGEHPAYRGMCVEWDPGEGRKRLYCRPKGPRLTPAQAACGLSPEGHYCTRPSGAEGRCFRVGSFTAVGHGGVSTVELPINECRYLPPDKSAETREAIRLLAGTIVACGVFVTVLLLRRRAAAKPGAG